MQKFITEGAPQTRIRTYVTYATHDIITVFLSLGLKVVWMGCVTKKMCYYTDDG